LSVDIGQLFSASSLLVSVVTPYGDTKNPEQLERLRVQFQFGLSKPSAHSPQIVELFLECATNDSSVIQAIESQACQDRLHESLESCWSVAQPEGHDLELPQPSSIRKCPNMEYIGATGLFALQAFFWILER